MSGELSRMSLAIAAQASELNAIAIKAINDGFAPPVPEAEFNDLTLEEFIKEIRGEGHDFMSNERCEGAFCQRLRLQLQPILRQVSGPLLQQAAPFLQQLEANPANFVGRTFLGR